MPDAAPEPPARNVFGVVEGVGKAVVGLGLTVVTLHLARYGAAGVGLLQEQYVMAGVWALVPLVGIAFAVTVVVGATLEEFRETALEPQPAGTRVPRAARVRRILHGLRLSDDSGGGGGRPAASRSGLSEERGGGGISARGLPDRGIARRVTPPHVAVLDGQNVHHRRPGRSGPRAGDSEGPRRRRAHALPLITTPRAS